MKIFKKIFIGLSVLFLVFIITFSYLWVRMIDEMQSVATGDKALVCSANKTNINRVENLLLLPPKEIHEIKTYIKEKKDILFMKMRVERSIVYLFPLVTHMPQLTYIIGVILVTVNIIIPWIFGQLVI